MYIAYVPSTYRYIYICRYMYMRSNGGDKYVYMVYKGKRKSIVKEKKGRKGCRVTAILFRAHTRCDGHCNRFAASLSLKKCRKTCIHIYIKGISPKWMCRWKKKDRQRRYIIILSLSCSRTKRLIGCSTLFFSFTTFFFSNSIV